MNHLRLSRNLTGLLLTFVFLGGCAAPTATPISTPTLPPPPPPQQLPPSPPASTQPTGQPEVKFVKTVQVTPDGDFLTGSFVRVNYVPATDRLVVTFDGELAHQSGDCGLLGHSYHEYTLDMQKAEKSGVYTCGAGDIGTLMIDNTLYDVKLEGTPSEGNFRWRISKYDATSWQKLAEVSFPLKDPRYAGGDEMVAYVNSQIDVSSQYQPPSGNPPPVEQGAATYHVFFSTDLQLLGERILADTPHINGSSMIYLDGIYYFVTADAFSGNVVVMQYDKDWRYLGVKTIIKQAHWSTGLAYNGGRFYVAYMDTSQRTDHGFLPVHLNVHLAAFDRNWNLLQDTAVTSFKPSDNRQPGRPWVIVHDNHLYVSYDVDTIDPATQQEQLKWQAFVSVYELTQKP
jgi:hypothetical protein